MARVLLILALVATAFWVFTIVDCAVQPPTRHRGVSKPVWIAHRRPAARARWHSSGFIVGRVRALGGRRPRAPDDDPEFLGRIGTISDQDERIRRLEEELAQLDAEDDDPAGTRRRARGLRRTAARTAAAGGRPRRTRRPKPPIRPPTATMTPAASAAPSADVTGPHRAGRARLSPATDAAAALLCRLVELGRRARRR